MAAGDTTVRVLEADKALEVTIQPGKNDSGDWYTSWSLVFDGQARATDVSFVITAGVPQTTVWTSESLPDGDHSVTTYQTDANQDTSTPITTNVEISSTKTSFEKIVPTLQQVSDLVRTRLIEEGGHAADVFTADTYPTAAQAQRLIEQAANAIFVQIPGSVAEPWSPAGQHLSALYAAILIEASYFREQLTDDQVQLYRDLLISGIKGLGAAIEQQVSGERMQVDTVVMRSLAATPPWVATYNDTLRQAAELEAMT